MSSIERVLVIQTAFAGDLVLTLPLVSETRRLLDAEVDVLCIPGTAPLLEGHPDIARSVVYDKHGKARMRDVVRMLKERRYDLCISPHRSARSAMLAWMSGARRRVSYDRSALSWLYTDRVAYRGDAHEAERALDLLRPLTASRIDFLRRPALYPSERHRMAVRAILEGIPGHGRIACIAPGSVWATKRWTVEGFTLLCSDLARDHRVLLIGGSSDRELCTRIADAVKQPHVVNAAGELDFLSSAALIGEAAVLVSNDSAPVHLASAMGTPVVEIFGATVPRFGFTPFGVPHEIVDAGDMPCRPCGIHGGNTCPIRTFACMRDIDPQTVIEAARRLASFPK